MKGIEVKPEEFNKPIPSFRCPICDETFDLRECKERFARFTCKCRKEWRLTADNTWVAD